MGTISNKDLEERFDEGESVLAHKKDGTEKVFKNKMRKVNVDFPSWMVDALDIEAQRIGVTRQALIKTIIDEELKRRQVA